MKREDLIHEEISGNKWRKLKYNVQNMRVGGYKTLLTFGGAYSNHIAATAAVGKYFGINTIGIIRGEEGFENTTLSKAKADGMQLRFISRADFKQKNEPAFQEKLKAEFGGFYIVPEGGANELGVKGCEEVLDEVKSKFDYITTSAGTGTTAAGICRRLTTEKLLVFPALKGGDFIADEMAHYCEPKQMKKIKLFTDYHFGGYGKVKPELIDFMQDFKATYNIQLDQVYTSKMLFGLFECIEKGEIPKGAKVLAIHTGGVQGNG